MPAMTPYEEFIHVSRYARYRDDKGRRETWDETVDRYMDFMVGHLKKKCDYTVPEKEKARVRSFIYDRQSLPSMRALMTAGPALERSNIAGFNCSALPIDHPRSFDEVLYILMNGTGVGFSVESKYVSKLPEVAENFHHTDTVITVADSKEGWARSYRELLSLLWTGSVPAWDVSRVRPAGARLKVFGGRASGPAPLEDLFTFTVDLFQKAAGRQLTTLEAHDLVCKIASVVVVGGVRRSALISLSDLSDDRMAKAKSGNWWEHSSQRALANNSVVYTCKPDTGSFMQEWTNLYLSKSGERGMLNRAASQRQAAKYGKRSKDIAFLTNPCISFDTLLLTSDGLRKIGDLAETGERFEIFNGDGQYSSSVAWETGVKPVFRVGLSNGMTIDLTGNHTIEVMEKKYPSQDTYCVPVERTVEELSVGDRILPMVGSPWAGGVSVDDTLATSLGILFGDGYREGDKNAAISTREPEVLAQLSDAFGDRFVPSGKDGLVWRIKGARADLDKFGISLAPLPERVFPEALFTWTAQSARAFIRGMFSANGGAMPKHNRIDIKATCLPMIRDLQRMMSGLGFSTYITTNKPMEIEWDNGTYTLNVGTKAGRRTVKVVSIEPIGEQPVYDFNESKTHWGWANGFKVHNCSEIILRPYQFCNLSTVVVRPEDTLDDLKEKVDVASILGTWQSTLIDFKYLRRIWQKNTEEEHLLGVSMTGQFGHPVLSGQKSLETLGEWLDELREVAVATNADHAKRIGIDASAAITCVKPEGSGSQLVGAASGMHPWHNDYYVRTIRADKKDPLTRFMSDAGVPVEDDVYNPEHTSIFSFPMAAPEGALTRKDLTAIQHLELWLLYQDHWCDHKPSVTISVHEDEWMAVGAWVWEHFDVLSGVSFLPYSEHIYKQAPYQDIDRDEYEARVYEMPNRIDWDALSLYESGDQTTGSQELSCVAGNCDIIEIGTV